MNLPVHPDECDHSLTELRYRLDKNGNKRYQRQCQDCWQPVGSCIRKDVAAKEIPLEQISPFDEPAQARQWSDWQEVIRAQAAAELKYLKPQYDEYIRSDSWRGKRERVMNRANNRCEGCGLQRATQVHHLTYENVGNEFLWELVAVCDECHERAHPWQLDEIGITAEMRRQRLHRELERSPLFRNYFRSAKANISFVFDLGASAEPTDVARDKDKMIGEALWNEYLQETGQKPKQ